MLNIILTISAIVVPIIFERRKQKKSINYQILQKEDNYKLFFWNSSAQVIKKELLKISAIAPIESKITLSCSNDKIPITISKPKIIKVVGKTDTYYKFKIRPKYMCAKTGYVLNISCPTKDSKIGLYGRIKFEDRYSVRYNTTLYGGNKNVRRILRKFDIITLYLELFWYIVILIIGPLFVYFGNIIFQLIGWGYILLGFVGLITVLFRSKMPWGLKKELRRCRKEGYYEFEDLDRLFFYQNLDLKIKNISSCSEMK